jgi:hypothetical protein
VPGSPGPDSAAPRSCAVLRAAFPGAIPRLVLLDPGRLVGHGRPSGGRASPFRDLAWSWTPGE